MKPAILGASLLLLLAACAGTTSLGTNEATLTATGDIQSETTQDFDVAVDQIAAPMAMPASSGDRTPAAPLDVQYAITVTNHTSEPVTVKRIALSTPPGPFTIPVTQRSFKTSIAPGGNERIEFWATGNARDANAGANAPTIIRTRITFETSGGTKRSETFLRRVNGAFSLGVG
jgi:hypothetical protein